MIRYRSMALRLTLGMTIAAILSGCDDSSMAGNISSTCEAPSVWQYTAPGCGASVVPICGAATQNDCEREACSCFGRTIHGCDHFLEPFERLGACESAEAVRGTETTDSGPSQNSSARSLAEGGTASRVDASTTPLGEGGTTPLAEGGTTSRADASATSRVDASATSRVDASATSRVDASATSRVDASATSRADGGTATNVDSGGGPQDASDRDGGTCVAPNVRRHTSPGCGSAAQPVCGPPVQGDCLRLACSCLGHTIMGCDYFAEAFEHTGECGPDSK